MHIPPPPPVSPDAIHEHVKTKQLEHRARMHYTAPEYAGNHTCTCTYVAATWLLVEWYNIHLHCSW